MKIKADAQIQLSVSHSSGLSVKIEMSGSKNFFRSVLTNPDESTIYLLPNGRDSVQAALVSVLLKHSHLGEAVPFSSMKSQLHIPRPAQLTGQNISGQALVNRGQVTVDWIEASAQSLSILILAKSSVHCCQPKLT